ncbi:Voltage-gated potassium channel [Actinomyces bovis]|uniref:Voltage-gated potassium channel n=2 Tax=Actinomyces bovis TaxID=1658 RepID=A0ABY1VQU8_9ACTO|nr:Voltage-gated potassium channel [Actinomyces bovis]VEG53139.1 Voltage-gated potassium channel [Actinomyces israelii]
MEWPLASAALVFLATYTWEVLADLRGEARDSVELILSGIWVLFTADYLIRLWLAPDRKEWALGHLPEAAAVILPMLRPLRLLRLVTLIGILQRKAGAALQGRIALYTAANVSLLAFVAALAALDAERHAPHATITSFGDALWWAITTITTVGYGDLSPVTTGGRLVAVLLMIGGVALIGVVTATLASWIVALVTEENDEQEAATRMQVEELRVEVTRLAKLVETLSQSADPKQP